MPELTGSIEVLHASISEVLVETTAELNLEWRKNEEQECSRTSARVERAISVSIMRGCRIMAGGERCVVMDGVAAGYHWLRSGEGWRVQRVGQEGGHE